MMERITEEEKELIETLEVLEEDILFIEDVLEEAKELKKSLIIEKELVYFSGGIIILKFIYKENSIDDLGNKIEGEEYTIFQLCDRYTKENQ